MSAKPQTLIVRVAQTAHRARDRHSRFDGFLFSYQCTMFKPDVDSYLNELRLRGQTILAEAEALAEIFARCESPIEQSFLLTYLRLFPTQLTRDLVIEDINAGEVDRWVAFRPQYKIDNYRVDFYFFQAAASATGPTQAIINKRVAVEIDGHDFHERTKEQAQRDRSRDRFMLQRGVFVLRYTGAEVFQRPTEVVEEVRTFVMS